MANSVKEKFLQQLQSMYGKIRKLDQSRSLFLIDNNVAGTYQIFLKCIMRKKRFMVFDIMIYLF